MNRRRLKSLVWSVLMVGVSTWLYPPGAVANSAMDRKDANPDKSFIVWQAPAKLRRIVGSERGDLTIGSDGIEFHSLKSSTMKWPFLEVQTFRLSPHSLTIETYQNRKRHLPGMERYRFELDQPMSPLVAAELARAVQRPSQNALPDTTSQGYLIPAHHRTGTGGTNGTLRFRDGGIDYLTTAPGDSRSWRWADLQTISNPEPYQLFLFGYRDTYTFDLKERLPQLLSHHLIDALDADSTGNLLLKPDIRIPNDLQKDSQGSWR